MGYDEGSYITPPSAAEASREGSRGGRSPDGESGRGRRRGREDFEEGEDDDGQSYKEEVDDDISEMEGEDSMDYGAQSSTEELF